MMRYEGTVYRPPSEAKSLILQLTIGCARNQCTFCQMYKDKKFRIRSIEDILEDIRLAHKYYRFGVKKIFLADGDALIMKTEQLLTVLQTCYDTFPTLQRVTAYGAPRDILEKTPEELKMLRKAGLEMIYMGAESGCDEVLRKVKKMATQAELIEAGQKLKETNIKSSITLISGLGGKELFREHAVESAKIISAIKPEYASMLTLLIEPSTELYEQVQRGEFQPLDGPEDVLYEMKLFLTHIDSAGTVFRANHASNYLPLAGNLNESIPSMIRSINEALARRNFRLDAFRQL